MRNGKERRKKTQASAASSRVETRAYACQAAALCLSLAVLHIITCKTPDATQKYLAFPIAFTTLPKTENFDILESGFISQCTERRIQMPPPQIAC